MNLVQQTLMRNNKMEFRISPKNSILMRILKTLYLFPILLISYIPICLYYGYKEYPLHEILFELFYGQYEYRKRQIEKNKGKF